MARHVHLLRGRQVGSLARNSLNSSGTETEKKGGGGEAEQVWTCRSSQDVS